MKFSIGDKVLLKRTDEEGTVVAILSPVMMEVEVKGVHFPVYTDDVDHPYLKWFTQKKKARPAPPAEIPAEPQKQRPVRLSQGIYLSFMPVYVLEAMEDIVAHFRVYLLNETAAPIWFSYEVKSAAGRQLFSHHAGLHAFGHLYIHTLTLEEMNEQPRFHWLLSDSAAARTSSECKGVLRIKPARLFDQIVGVQQTGAPSFSYLLTEEVTGPLTAKKTVEKIPLSAVQVGFNTTGELMIKPEWQPKPVLDLHIEHLSVHYATFSAAEILALQLSTLEYHLDMAIAHRQDRMIIVHGLGTGALRSAVQDILNRKEGIGSFSCDWHGKYGYGATEVRFK